MVGYRKVLRSWEGSGGGGGDEKREHQIESESGHYRVISRVIEGRKYYWYVPYSSQEKMLICNHNVTTLGA